MSQPQVLPQGYQASPGYPSQPAPNFGTQQPVHPGYGTQQPQQQVIVMGNCSVCRSGNIIEEFTPIGIVLAVLFFPIGILCCFLMQEKKCNRCGAKF